MDDIDGLTVVRRPTPSEIFWDRVVVAFVAILVPASLLSSPPTEDVPVSDATVVIAEPRDLLQVPALVEPPSRPPSLLLPVLGVTRESLRDSFGDPRGGGRRHRAIDILAPRDTPVLAAVDGFIADLDTNPRGGICIHQFDAERRRSYYYAHLERYAAGLEKGVTVRQGDVIGYVGSSGNAPPTAPHLHFAVYELRDQRWLGQPVNPYPLLAASP